MLVSVIVPTYNRAHYLPLTIESLVHQDLDPGTFEIIVCDNNSTIRPDPSSTQSRNDPRFRSTTCSSLRQGVHYARNTAAKHAKGKVLYFTDDDMLADPQMLQRDTEAVRDGRPCCLRHRSRVAQVGADRLRPGSLDYCINGC
jgi:glycosyltransferase involved in cell wall biosynthesis